MHIDVYFEMCKPYNYTESALLSETLLCVFLDLPSEHIGYIHYN